MARNLASPARPDNAPIQPAGVLRLRRKQPEDRASTPIERLRATSRPNNPNRSAAISIRRGGRGFRPALRGRDCREGYSCDRFAELAKASGGSDDDGTRAEFVDLVELARSMN
jgi:hypothetical protein